MGVKSEEGQPVASSGITHVQLSGYWSMSGLEQPHSLGQRTKSHQERMTDGLPANRMDENKN